MFELSEILDGLPEKETATFFAVFARFEFALMHQGYLESTQESSRASPNWGRLATRLGNGFLDRADVVAPTIISEPPRKLIVQGGQAGFGNASTPPVNTTQLLEYVRQIRNNLFHGNKMFARNRARDRQLITEAVNLLDLIMEEVPELRGSFEEPQG